MAQTQEFLDYNGLQKVVQKVDDLYLSQGIDRVKLNELFMDNRNKEEELRGGLYCGDGGQRRFVDWDTLFAGSDFDAAPGDENHPSEAFATYPFGSTLVVPGSFEYIPENAFDGVTQIDKVVISENIKSIGGYAFGHNNLHTVVLPSGLKKIDAAAFMGCTNVNFKLRGTKVPAGYPWGAKLASSTIEINYLGDFIRNE